MTTKSRPSIVRKYTSKTLDVVRSGAEGMGHGVKELEEFNDHVGPVREALLYLIFMVFYLLSTFQGLNNADIFFFGDQVYC
jgi:hypothetical protein